MNISFEKGVYTIEHDGKKYLVNLNDRTIISCATNNIVKKMAFRVGMFFDFIMASQRETNIMLWSLGHSLEWEGYTQTWHAENLSLLATIEKFTNLGYSYSNNYDLYNFARILKTNSDIKLAMRVVNEMAKRNGLQYVDVGEARNAMYVEKIMLKNPKCDKAFLLTHIDEVRDWIAYNGDKNLDIFMYYYYTQKLYVLFPIYDIRNYLNEYLKMCKKLGKEPVKTSNFTRELIETKETYERLKAIHDKEKFAEIHDKLAKKVSFETEKFTVVIPQEPKDLIMEGERMHHCVGTYVDKVLKEETYIVFIRKKEDIDTPYITCQISLNGNIGQYYLAYDRKISLEEDKEFKEAYQKFLCENWRNEEDYKV